MALLPAEQVVAVRGVTLVMEARAVLMLLVQQVLAAEVVVVAVAARMVQGVVVALAY